MERISIRHNKKEKSYIVTVGGRETVRFTNKSDADKHVKWMRKMSKNRVNKDNRF